MINIVKKELELAEDTIDILEDKVSKLQEALDYFKKLLEKILSSYKINSFLQINKIT